jgi:hypothetical protein
MKYYILPSAQIYKLAGSSLSDEAIRNTLQEKLLPYGSISYLEMATAAYQKGRRRLATMILDIVQNAVDQACTHLSAILLPHFFRQITIFE